MRSVKAMPPTPPSRFSKPFTGRLFEAAHSILQLNRLRPKAADHLPQVALDAFEAGVDLAHRRAVGGFEAGGLLERVICGVALYFRLLCVLGEAQLILVAGVLAEETGGSLEVGFGFGI